jgi:hypothetical protein
VVKQEYLFELFPEDKVVMRHETETHAIFMWRFDKMSDIMLWEKRDNDLIAVEGDAIDNTDEADHYFAILMNEMKMYV